MTSLNYRLLSSTYIDGNVKKPLEMLTILILVVVVSALNFGTSSGLWTGLESARVRDGCRCDNHGTRRRRGFLLIIA